MNVVTIWPAVVSAKYLLESDAQFLLCSDGLHGVVTPVEIVETLSGDGSLEDKCKILIDAAKRAGGPDNVTAVLLRNGANGHGNAQ